MKLFEITDKYDAANYFNEISHDINTSTLYEVVDSGIGENVISNVPLMVYSNEKLKKYKPPKGFNKYNSKKIIDFLHNAFNFLNNSGSGFKFGHEDGKMFHYNYCCDNAVSAYMFLLNLSKNNNLPVSYPASICFGYVSRRIFSGALIGDAVVNIKNLTVHNWHCWNKINNFIIDLSIGNSGGIYSLETGNIEWKDARDHVFRYPPENLSYHGIDFVDHDRYSEFVEELFGSGDRESP